MATKLRPLNTEMETSTIMMRPVRPILIRASTSIMPEARRRRVLVDVILQTISGNVGRVGPIAVHGAGLPVDCHNDHFHLVAVAGGDGTAGDGNRAAVGDAVVGGGVGIVAFGERGRDGVGPGGE